MHSSIYRFVLLWAGCQAAVLSAQEWSRFQNGGKLSLGEKTNLKVNWSTKDIAWEIPLTGYGQSSPVIHQRNLYVTSVSGEMKENLHIHAFDRVSGKLLWKHDDQNSQPEKNTSYVSRAAPSPVCGAEGVIAFFAGGDLIALTPEGQLRWRRNLKADLGAIGVRHGVGGSLEQNQQHVFVWVERQEKPYVLAISKKTGETVWKADGLGSTSWSSPRLVSVGDSQHLVLSGIGKLAGLDAKTGKRLWSFDKISGNSTPTPIPLGEGKFFIGATVGRGGEAGNAAASNGVIQIEKTADNTFQAKYVWRAKRATSSFGSPLPHRGRVYLVNRSGVVYCLDLKTGEEQYAKRTSSSVWATPIGVGERVYLFGKNGVTTVIQAGSEFQELAVNTLWESKPSAARGFGGPVLYAAVAAGDDLFLRRGDRLYKIAGE